MTHLTLQEEKFSQLSALWQSALAMVGRVCATLVLLTLLFDSLYQETTLRMYGAIAKADSVHTHGQLQLRCSIVFCCIVASMSGIR